MPLKIAADDLAGRFRSGHQINDRPASLEEWRVTTGDPDVATRVHEILGGEEPQEWAARGEDNIEVFTSATTVDIIIESPKALRQRMVLWGRSGKPIYVSDEKGDPTDEQIPDDELSFQESNSRTKIGAVPDIDLTFRLAADPDLGIFQFKTGSWGLARDLAAEDIEGQIAAVGGPVLASLTLSPESFTPKAGPMKGKLVSFTKSSLVIKGAAA